MGVHTMEFERGKTTRKLEVIGKTKNTGTYVVFNRTTDLHHHAGFQFNMLSTACGNWRS